MVCSFPSQAPSVKIRIGFSCGPQVMNLDGPCLKREIKVVIWCRLRFAVPEPSPGFCMPNALPILHACAPSGMSPPMNSALLCWSIGTGDTGSTALSSVPVSSSCVSGSGSSGDDMAPLYSNKATLDLRLKGPLDVVHENLPQRAILYPCSKLYKLHPGPWKPFFSHLHLFRFQKGQPPCDPTSYLSSLPQVPMQGDWKFLFIQTCSMSTLKSLLGCTCPSSPSAHESVYL